MFSSKIKYVTRVQVEAEVRHWGQGVLGGKREEAVDWTGLRRAWELSWVCALGGFGQRGGGQTILPVGLEVVS